MADAIRAGDFRHVATVERKTVIKDPQTGYRETVWVPRLVGERAQFLPGPGREFLAGEAVRSAVDARVVFRYHSGTAAIDSVEERVILDGDVWSIKAPPLLDATRRRTVTVMIAKEPNDGA